MWYIRVWVWGEGLKKQEVVVAVEVGVEWLEEFGAMFRQKVDAGRGERTGGKKPPTEGAFALRSSESEMRNIEFRIDSMKSQSLRMKVGELGGEEVYGGEGTRGLKKMAGK